jgi:hypothetical protein
MGWMYILHLFRKMTGRNWILCVYYGDNRTAKQSELMHYRTLSILLAFAVALLPVLVLDEAPSACSDDCDSDCHDVCHCANCLLQQNLQADHTSSTGFPIFRQALLDLMPEPLAEQECLSQIEHPPQRLS